MSEPHAIRDGRHQEVIVNGCRTIVTEEGIVFSGSLPLLDDPVEVLRESLVEIDRLQAECAAMRQALEIANDCLFGNTHEDSFLKEAYETVHQTLASNTGAQWQERYMAMKRVVEAGAAWIRRRHATIHEIGPNEDDLKALKKECVELERTFTRALADLEAMKRADKTG